MSQSGHAQPAERVHATGLASLGIAAADASHNGQEQPAERVHSEVETAIGIPKTALTESPGSASSTSTISCPLQGREYY